MLSESGASDSPAWSALYSRTICRKIGSAIIAPPSATCWSIWPEIPSRKCFERNRSGSISVMWPSRLRRTSHQARSPSDAAPVTRNAPTASPPSCQIRIPSTMPPMPRTDRTAPTTSIRRSPMYGTSRMSPLPATTTMITMSSPRKPTRHDRNVVMKPPRSGPIAAAMAADAPTRA